MHHGVGEFSASITIVPHPKTATTSKLSSPIIPTLTISTTGKLRAPLAFNTKICWRLLRKGTAAAARADVAGDEKNIFVDSVQNSAEAEGRCKLDGTASLRLALSLCWRQKDWTLFTVCQWCACV